MREGLGATLESLRTCVERARVLVVDNTRSPTGLYNMLTQLGAGAVDIVPSAGTSGSGSGEGGAAAGGSSGARAAAEGEAGPSSSSSSGLPSVAQDLYPAQFERLKADLLSLAASPALQPFPHTASFRDKLEKLRFVPDPRFPLAMSGIRSLKLQLDQVMDLLFRAGLVLRHPKHEHLGQDYKIKKSILSSVDTLIVQGGEPEAVLRATSAVAASLAEGGLVALDRWIHVLGELKDLEKQLILLKGLGLRDLGAAVLPPVVAAVASCTPEAKLQLNGLNAALSALHQHLSALGGEARKAAAVELQGRARGMSVERGVGIGEVTAFILAAAVQGG
jgi:hypothetical protein